MRPIILALIIGVGLAGCTPPGPRALLQGKKLVDEGRYSDAVPALEKGTSLLPKYAPGWNYLGLAYQGNNQPELALRAYRTALSVDHNLAAAHFNMGCLYLDHTNFPAAIDELRSYTLLQPSALPGWLKLGTAQLRARRLDDAEKSFRAALELQARHPEALNGLGLVQVQRRRWQDALNYFNAAVAQDPSYAPALLNGGLVSQQQFGARSQALKRYHQYLDLRPRPPAADSVEALVRQLEGELGTAAASVKPALTNAPPSVAAKSNLLAGLTPVTRAPLPARTNHAVAPVQTPKPVAPPPTSTSSGAVSVAKAPVVEPPAPPARTTPTRPPEPEVTKVPDELLVKPAGEVAATRTNSEPPTEATTVATPPAPGSPRGTNAPKRSLLARLNPFAGKPKTPDEPAARTVTTDVATNVAVTAAPAPAQAPALPRATLASGGSRYSYLSPAKPSPGDRAEADKAFRRGIKAQQAGDRARAIAEYQSALQTDPAFFNAYYNLGLAALDAGNLRLSLAAYETALTVNPESADARYNFALALKNAGHYQDAADQLSRILAANPDDARAHLAAANLYAQQLRQTKEAREHYLKVLELSPKHPEAAKIRFWLAANP